MPVVSVPGMRPVNMGELAVDMERRADGTMLVRPCQALEAYPRSIIDRLDHWAATAPDRPVSVTPPPSRCR